MEKIPEWIDLQDQVRDHIRKHDLFNWDEALTGEEMTYLENLLLTFAPIFYPGSVGFKETVEPYLKAKDKALSDANKEIERRNKLIEGMYRGGYHNELIDSKWQQFKTENNL